MPIQNFKRKGLYNRICLIYHRLISLIR